MKFKKKLFTLLTIALLPLFLTPLFLTTTLSKNNVELKNNNISTFSRIDDTVPNICRKITEAVRNNSKRIRLSDKLSLLFISCNSKFTEGTNTINYNRLYFALDTTTKQIEKEKFKDVKVKIVIANSALTIGDFKYRWVGPNKDAITGADIPVEPLTKVTEITLDEKNIIDESNIAEPNLEYFKTSKELNNFNTTDLHIFITKRDKVSYEYDGKKEDIDKSFVERIGSLNDTDDNNTTNVKESPLIEEFTFQLDPSKYASQQTVHLKSSIKLANGIKWETLLKGMPNYNLRLKYNFISFNAKSLHYSEYSSFTIELDKSEDDTIKLQDDTIKVDKTFRLKDWIRVQDWPQERKTFLENVLKDDKNIEWFPKLSIIFYEKPKPDNQYQAMTLLPDSIFQDKYLATNSGLASIKIDKKETEKNKITISSYSRNGFEKDRSLILKLKIKKGDKEYNINNDFKKIKVFEQQEISLLQNTSTLAEEETEAKITEIEVGYKIGDKHIKTDVHVYDNRFWTDDKIKVIPPTSTAPNLPLVIGLSVGIPIAILFFITFIVSYRRRSAQRRISAAK